MSRTTSNPAPCATLAAPCSATAALPAFPCGGWAAPIFLLAIVCLRGNQPLARLMAMVALFLDSVLLVVMFFTRALF